jgi:hypothetical protein
MNNVRVELIPWIHADEFMAHRMALRYIRNLPPGSYLGLEASTPDIQLLERDIQESPETLKRIWMGEFPQNYVMGSDNRAFLEVVLACHKRGIHIVPLEHDAIKNAASLSTADSVKREAYMIMTTVSTVQQLKEVSIFPVLTGAAHTHSLYDFLKRNHVPVIVRTRLFDYAQRDMARIVNLERRRRKIESATIGEKTEKLDAILIKRNWTMNRLSPKIYTTQSEFDKARELFKETAQWQQTNPIRTTIQQRESARPSHSRKPKPNKPAPRKRNPSRRRGK